MSVYDVSVYDEFVWDESVYDDSVYDKSVYTMRVHIWVIFPRTGKMSKICLNFFVFEASL